MEDDTPITSEIPRSLLERIDNFVHGGYILAYIDSDGETSVINTIVHPTLSRGAREKIKDYFNFLDMLENSPMDDMFIDDMNDADENTN